LCEINLASRMTSEGRITSAGNAFSGYTLSWTSEVKCTLELQYGEVTLPSFKKMC
jgi:hypothetical protein